VEGAQEEILGPRVGLSGQRAEDRRTYLGRFLPRIETEERVEGARVLDFAQGLDDDFKSIRITLAQAGDQGHYGGGAEAHERLLDPPCCVVSGASEQCGDFGSVTEGNEFIQEPTEGFVGEPEDRGNEGEPDCPGPVRESALENAGDDRRGNVAEAGHRGGADVRLGAL
jgi:hypothetical protein